MQEHSVGFIIDSCSPYSKNLNVVTTFKIHGKIYCIRRIDKFEWGQPIFHAKSIEDEFSNYCVYDTVEEALGYIKYLKKLEGSTF